MKYRFRTAKSFRRALAKLTESQKKSAKEAFRIFREDPFDPRQNVMGGAKYLRRLLDQYRGDVPLALASYNAGATSVAQYGGVPPFPETQNYVKQITRLVDSSRRARTK